MSSLSEADQKLVSRFVDGEMTGRDLADFERRLLQDHPLREAVDAQREAREWFGQVREDPVAGGTERAERSSAFVDRVLNEARRLPSRRALLREAGEFGESELLELAAMRTGRGLVAAAVLLLGASLLLAGGLLRRPDSGRLEAVDQKRVEQIDREIQADARRREVERPPR